MSVIILHEYVKPFLWGSKSELGGVSFGGVVLESYCGGKRSLGRPGHLANLYT